MRPVRVVTDSAADLPLDLVERLQISVVPLVVTVGEQSYRETDLSPDAFWDLADTTEHPCTSQPPMGAFREAFVRLVDEGYQVFCTTITSKHSGTYYTAQSAVQGLEEHVTIFDSLSLSMGMGCQVIRAAELAAQGMGLEAIRDALIAFRARVHLALQLDTVEFIRRGGRVAKLLPTIDRVTHLLHLYPLLNIQEGELSLLSMARSHQKAIAQLVYHLAHQGPPEILIVMHIRAAERAEQLADELARQLAFARERIYIGEAGAVLASHGGRGVIGAAIVSAVAAS